MKKIRKSSKSIAYFLILAIINLHFSSCSSKSDVERMSDKFSAKEVFRGIIFLDGNFAEKVPTLKSLKAQQEVMYETAMSSATRDESKSPSLFGDYGTFDEEKKAVADYFTSEIEKLSPTFFNEFQAAINSGNVENIRTQLRAAATFIETILMRSDKFAALNQWVELAKTEGGINIDNYDLTKPEEVTQYNEDVEHFAELYHPELLKPKKDTAVAVVAIVVVWVFVAVGVLAVVALAGAVAVAYYVAISLYVAIHNRVVWSKKSASTDGPDAVFLENQLIAELIAINGN